MCMVVVSQLTISVGPAAVWGGTFQSKTEANRGRLLILSRYRNVAENREEECITIMHLLCPNPSAPLRRGLVSLCSLTPLHDQAAARPLLQWQACQTLKVGAGWTSRYVSGMYLRESADDV